MNPAVPKFRVFQIIFLLLRCVIGSQAGENLSEEEPIFPANRILSQGLGCGLVCEGTKCPQLPNPCPMTLSLLFLTAMVGQQGRTSSH